MSTYPKLEVLSDNFNLADFTDEDKSLSLYEANDLYIKSAGDSVDDNLSHV